MDKSWISYDRLSSAYGEGVEAFLEITRGGRREKVSIYDVVVGDVIPLNIGDQVPADGLLIKGHSLAIDESSMTGESKIVHKDQKAPFLMSGCKVADGSGTMLVTSVGINTEWGLLMASISEDTGEETPLQVRLNGVATFIGIVELSVALLVLAVLLARFFTGNSKHPDGTVQFVRGKTSVSEAINDVIKIFTAAVTIVVVAVPEGLPLAVTLTLAYSMKKMMADKALVRRLSACETMGSATTICSDKTGTLTMNQMTVVEAYVGQKKIDSPEDILQYHRTVTSLLNEGIAQNTAGSVFSSKMQETGKTKDEIDRASLWKRARMLKNGEFNEDVKVVVAKIDELHELDDSEDVTCGTNDVLTQALRTNEQRGRVRGMGRFVLPQHYFFLPKTMKQYLNKEKLKNEKRFNKLEEELNNLKRGMGNVSEAGSCQFWGGEDFEEDPPDELDNMCYLAVDVPTNIVAKGVILADDLTEELVEVLLEVSLEGETSLPVPIKEEFIVKVKHAIGHTLTWPKDLVI